MKDKKKIKKSVNSYVEENQLRPAEDLLKKDLPVTLMPLFDEKFGGIDLDGMSIDYYLKEYKKFLKELRKVYKVKKTKQLTKKR